MPKCQYCSSFVSKIYKIESLYACEYCKEKLENFRKCQSKTHKCQEENICSLCQENYHSCRTVNVWSANLQQNSKKVLVTKGFIFVNNYEDNKLMKVCALCAQHSGITHSWVCKPEYLYDHSLACCGVCKNVNLSDGKFYGRGPCCKFN